METANCEWCFHYNLMLKYLLKNKSVLKADFFAETSKVGEFGRRESVHLTRDIGHYFGKKRGDEAVPFISQTDDYKPAIRRVAFAENKAGLLKVIDDQGKIAPAFEELLGQLTLAERTEMIEGFKNAELGDGETVRKNCVDARGDGFGRTLKFDKRIQGVDFLNGTLMSRSHTITLIRNNTMSK